MNDGSTKVKLLKLLKQVRAQEERFVAELSEAARDETGTLQRWAARDVMAHINYGREQFARTLPERGRGYYYTSGEDGDQINAQVFEKNRARSMEDVQAEAARVFAVFLAEVERLTEAQLDDPSPAHWYPNLTLLASLVRNSINHPLAHFTTYYVEHGQIARARELHETMAPVLLDFDPSDANRGLVLYNVACINGLSGERARALELLREALSLRADLVEWSQQDSDLDSLRELPEYRALYEPPPA